MKKHIQAIALLAFAPFAGCATEADITEPATTAPGKTPDAPAPAEAKLLLSLPQEDGHTVDFLEFAPGVVALRELTPKGQKPRLTSIQSSGRSLEDYYHALTAPGTDLPEVLKGAAARVREREEAALGEPAKFAPTQSRGPASSAPIQTQDWNDDANWFLANFCYGGVTWCPTNVGWAWAQRNANYVKVSCMAAGFDSNARFTASYYQCNVWDRITGNCRWEALVNEPVFSRYIHTFVYTSGGDFYSSCTGEQPNPRIHMSVATHD